MIKFEFTESFMRIILVFENKSFAGMIFKIFVLFIFIYRLIELLDFFWVFHSTFGYLIVVVEALFVHSQLHGYVFVVYQNIVQRFEINVFFNFHVAMLVLVKLIWLVILRDFNQVWLWKIYSHFVTLLNKITNFYKAYIIFVLKC